MLTVLLTERRPWVGRVPVADRVALRDHFRHAVEVEPADAGRTRVTARGVAGWFRTPSRLWVVRGKFPWADLARLVAPEVEPPPAPAGGVAAGADPFAALLADRLALLLEEQARRGWLRDYRVVAADSATVQGRLDFARMAQRPRPAGEPLPLWRDEFTADVVWNRLPKLAGERLLSRPGLPPASRERLRRRLEPLADVAPAAGFPPDWDALPWDARAESYRPLLAWCRVVASAFGDGDGSQLLLPLERLFEDHLARLLAHPRLSRHPEIALAPATGRLAPLKLVPDFTTRNSVWDAKWKPVGRGGPDAGDVQQVLAYALLLGVKRAGLIVPGRRWSVARYAGPNGVTLRVARLPLAGTPAEQAEGACRLRRLVLRGVKSV